MKQRELMQKLVRELGPNQEAVCTAYAEAEQRGEVNRSHNAKQKSAGRYATALWHDGKKKGWLFKRD